MKREPTAAIISLLFIILFVYAAVSKLLDYQNFTVQLGQSPLLTKYAQPVAWLIPLLETAIAILLAIPPLRISGLYLSFSLMGLFTAYIFTITRFTESIPCSCGGVLQKMSWDQHLVFNIFFMLLAFIGIMLHNGRPIST